jgi:hypothetical protein
MAHPLDPQPATPDQPAPRFLRFMTALVLGTAITAIAGGVAACDGSDEPNVDATVDAGPVDGPLPPPDLARVA